MQRKVRKQGGFTLVELAVVVVIIGILAAFAVPRFKASVERSKASEAFNYLAAIQSSEERYHSRQGQYASSISDLDIQLTAPKYFSVGSVTAGETSWSLTLTRTGASAGYGDYTITFTQDGFDSENSSITDHDDINPMQT